jgi:hypothetical protein
LNGTVPLSSSSLDAMQKKEEKWFFSLNQPLSPRGHQPEAPRHWTTDRRHWPTTRRAPARKPGEPNLDSSTQMADQPPRDPLPMRHSKSHTHLLYK